MRAFALKEVGRQWGQDRHERAGAVLAKWAIKKIDNGKAPIRIKTGPFGILDTPYDSKAYEAAAMELDDNLGVNIEVHRFYEEIAIPAFSRRDLIRAYRPPYIHKHIYDLLFVKSLDYANTESTVNQNERPNYISRVYPSEKDM
jgi:hypothetical protein